jgi:two-component system osmolarity sensor histidine kinase EnvZ
MQKSGAILKRYLPVSLYGRALLILVIPILGIQVVVATLFLQRHYDRVTAQMATAVASELNYAVRTVERAPSADAAQAALDEMAYPFGFEMGLDAGGAVKPDAIRAFYDLTGSVVAETLKAHVDRPLALDFLSKRKHVDAQIQTSKGVLRVLIRRGRLNASKPHLLLVWMISTGLGLTVVAAVFLRNQVKPIRDLARAAAAFGRGRSLPFRPRGAEEVRRAGQAFLDMRARIERQIGQRTLLLSGVSHDLRTPLTRMKLALAVGDDSPETRELARDVAEMEEMLDAFLDFARGVGAEAPEPVDPVALAEEVAEDARRDGARIAVFAEVKTPVDRELALRRAAVKRCLGNLVRNAQRHATEAALTVRLARRYVEFAVEDNGPGIPEAKRDEALRPFTRLDASRNQDEGSGVGLGLSIALDVARSHGGSLTLEDSARLGGLRATVVFPR